MCLKGCSDVLEGVDSKIFLLTPLVHSDPPFFYVSDASTHVVDEIQNGERI